MAPFFKSWKRHRLRKRPFPEEWEAYLRKHVPFYLSLPAELKEGFLEKLKIFAWEKDFTGARGFEITDEVRVVISAVAVRLILHLDLSYYDRLSEVVVYPYDVLKHPITEQEIVGEHHFWGIVILSWPALLEGLKNPEDGYEAGTHEFAHALDRSTGSYDGTPPLRDPSHYRSWARVMSKHFLRLRKGVALESQMLDEYGATNEAEFFAVATELYFERPDELKRRLPELYRELKKFYEGS